MDWVQILKDFIKGILFAFLVYILSGEGGVAVAFGILVIYLEVKERKYLHLKRE